MADFKMQQTFPIATLIDAIQRKAAQQNAQKSADFQTVLEGAQSLGSGIKNYVDNKKAIAQALAQAKVLAANPEVQGLLTGGDRPVTEVAGHPVNLNQTAQPGPDGITPIQNAPNASPQNIASLLAGGTKPTELLKEAQVRQTRINPVEDVIAQKDANGNIIGYQRISRLKGAKTLVTGPAPAARQSPSMSPDRASFQIVDKFNSNPQVRKAQQSLDGAQSVRELALSGNPIAAAAIPTYMARASGEVGNLSEADKAPFGGTKAILGRIEAALQQSATGQLTQDNQKFLVDIANIMERNANTNLDRHAVETASQYSKVKDINLSKDDILATLRPNYTPPQKATNASPKSDNVLSVGGTFHGMKIVGVREKVKK